MHIYDITLETITGKQTTMDAFKGKTLLIVNTASKCGYTKQFAALETLYKKYKDQGFTVLGFPCNQFLNQDPGNNEAILEFCTLHYGVTFPMFKKTMVKGKNKHPLFAHLIANSPVRTNKGIRWNFEKFLVNPQGDIVNRYPSKMDPLDIESDIKDVMGV